MNVADTCGEVLLEHPQPPLVHSASRLRRGAGLAEWRPVGGTWPAARRLDRGVGSVGAQDRQHGGPLWPWGWWHGAGRGCRTGGVAVRRLGDGQGRGEDGMEAAWRAGVALKGCEGAVGFQRAGTWQA
jgi:hypothetical protein